MENNYIYHIYTERQKNRDFWGLMGFYLGSRRIRREMPYIVDDIGYVWHVFTKQNNILGFVSTHQRKKRGEITSLYVIKNFRRHGIGTLLVEKAVCYLNDTKEIHTTATGKSALIFKNVGFQEIKRTRNYIYLCKKIGEN